ncbi:thrombospondin type 3 repeat-containing protein [Chryseobacterium aahli]|uniref:thrombospondin type 3 repeat-containing protein n=1 Tax=Chryseobacterium aahli TaxID=1278643 RepID=UPI001F61FD65|nr:thrombospondin type 3 repeat-containing protein [Chryseobacterium aahli]MCI3938281.1 thrombospondin type 3 repeat-containing protein [Chryseobacterium aahli]
MKKNIFKYVLVPTMILCAFGINFFKAQNWTTVWTENFNGLTYSSSYNNGVTGYWNNSANPPQNSQINGAFEATPASGIVAGTTQVPSDASGGRFLMFWTQGGVAIPASENVFFKKTMTVVPGKTYRINYRFATLGTVPGTAANRTNATFRVSPQGNTTSFYTSGMVVADVNAWKNVQYEFTVPSSVTSIDMTWENTTKATTGNDFALDDLVLQEAVDSDGDGIPDYIDDDDDNDGILDTAECGGGAIYNYSGFGIRTISATQANLIGLTGNTYTPTTIATNIIPGNDANHMTTDASRNRVLFANNIAQGSLFAYQFSTNTVVNVGSGFLSSLGDASGGAAMYNNDYFIYDDTGTTSQGLWRVTFNASGNASTLTKVVDPISGIDLGDIAINSSGMVYLIASTGALYKLDLSSLNLSITTPSSAWISVGTTASASGTQLFFGANGDLIGSNNGNLIRIDPNNAANLGTISTLTSGYSWGDISEAPSVGFSCGTDTDSDGIPNNLDLDSDGDGCTDAIEGGAAFTTANLVTATGTISTQTPNQNLGNTVGSTATTTGVPTIAGTGQSVGQSQNSTISECLDSDNDGVPNICDLDDDNDGILDIQENTCVLTGQTIRIGYIPNVRDLDGDNGYTFDGALMNNSGALKLLNTANFGPSGIVNANIVLVPMTTNPITKAYITSLNLNAIFLGGIDDAAQNSYLSSSEFVAIKDWSDDSPKNFVVSTQGQTVAWEAAITAGNINPDVPTSLGSTSSVFSGPFGSVSSFSQGGSYQAYFIPSTQCFAQIFAQDNSGRPVIYLDGIYNDLMIADVDILTSLGGVTAGNTVTSNNDRLFMNIWAFVAQQSGCTSSDTDADGIPNHLDLDSDNDGCLDAMEGDENVTVNMLVNAAPGLSVGTGSTAANQNLCASGTCVNANGVPTQVNSGGAADIGGDVGQGIGDSQNALISSGCYCYKPEVVVVGNPNPVKHGITSLNRANSGTSDWPVVRQSAWTVLESKTKGFVLNRMAFVDADSNTATPTTPPLASIPAANYVEGMMVYDTVSKCLKIYNGTIWSCFSTQTCPD